LSSGQTDRLGRFLVSQGGLLMKQQHETKALDGLDRHSTAGHGVEGHLQEIVREGTENGPRSWHGGILSLPGFLGSPPPSTKSPQKPRRYLWNGPLSLLRHCELSCRRRQSNPRVEEGGRKRINSLTQTP